MNCGKCSALKLTAIELISENSIYRTTSMDKFIEVTDLKGRPVKINVARILCYFPSTVKGESLKDIDVTSIILASDFSVHAKQLLDQVDRLITEAVSESADR